MNDIPRPQGPFPYSAHGNPFKVGGNPIHASGTDGGGVGGGVGGNGGKTNQPTEAFARDMLGHSIMSLDQELRVTALGLACRSNPPMDLSAEATTMIIYRAESFYHYLETGQVHE